MPIIISRRAIWLHWGRGLDEAGAILQKRAGRMHVLPGNHESLAAVERMCAKYGLDSFHEKTMEIAGRHVAGLGYSSPTPFDTPGEYSEEEIAERLRHLRISVL